MRLAAILILCASLTACSALEPEPVASPFPDTTTTTAGTKKKPRWKGQKAVHYRNAYRICSVFSVRELARQYNVKRKPALVARSHARRLVPKRFRPQAVRGCLDAFQDRPPRA